MGVFEWSTRALVGCLIGLGLAMFLVARHSDWTFAQAAVAALVVVALSVTVAIAGSVRRNGSSWATWSWRAVVFLVCMFVWSAVILAVVHYREGPRWIHNLPAAEGSDGVLWQVQTTFLSVGFAGLAIAAQLFAEAPLAIGASRGRVLEHVWAGWFVGVGLVSNLVIAVEVIWLPSDAGVLGVAMPWFACSVALLVFSSVRLMRLFGHPSLLDEVVRTSLVQTLISRLDQATRNYAAAHRQFDVLYAGGHLDSDLGSAPTLRVPVPQAGLIIRAIRPQYVRRAKAALVPQATDNVTEDSGDGDLFTPPRITLDVELGDRTRSGDTAFRVSTSIVLDDAMRAKLVQLLQSSIEFEPAGTVTTDEETDREIANLKDAIGTSLRSGAFGTAQRALELLGHVIQGAWSARTDNLKSSRRSSYTRRDWLFRSIGEVEQDAIISTRAADLFVSQALARALEAPRAGSADYVDECLRSFKRLWSDLLRHGDLDFNSVISRITTGVQNLAMFSFSTADEPEDLQARATWTLVELVKLALDAKRPEQATLAARELQDLFAYGDRHRTGRAHVRGGQLVLSGWVDYLADKQDVRAPDDARLRAIVTPRGKRAEILAARETAERATAGYSRWDWWETNVSGSAEAQLLELSHYVDRAELAALVSANGPLPSANDQETASGYKRFMVLLDEIGRDLAPREVRLRQMLNAEVVTWETAEDDRLAHEPLSPMKIAELTGAIEETLDSNQRLAAVIPTVDVVPDSTDDAHHVLGMNFRVPRHYLVDEIFNQTYADPKELGRIIARGFIEGEDRKILGELRSEDDEVVAPSTQAIRQHIEALGDDARYHVLVTPFGGLFDLDDWYSLEFRESLSKVKHIEIAALEDEAILFDQRATLFTLRHPEEKDQLSPVPGTSLALGVFEDVHDENEPHVRIETGETFVVWRTEGARVVRFGTPSEDETGDSSDEASGAE